MSSTILITGSASGIGRHLAGALSRRGHGIVASDVDITALERRAAEDRWDPTQVRLAKLDVRDAEAWEEALDLAEREHGGLDVVMNVAGVLVPGWAKDVRPEDIDFVLGVNVKGTMLGTRAAARRFLVKGKGHIVNFGSLASLAPVPGLGLYAASKFAVRGFSLAAAMELEKDNIAVTLVMPDAVQTPMLDMQVDHEEAAMTFSGPRPLTVEDIERAVVEKVLPERPLELTLPLSRGLLARAANTAPGVAKHLEPLMTKKGRAQQHKMKRNPRP
jgi:NAD(P)-dependent dehydrogenase (short-subunit alcohol dehydrogenase family)